MSTMFLFLIFLSVIIFLLSIFQSKKGNSYKETKLLFLFGIFVWGDGLIFAPLWAIALVFYWISNDPDGLILFISIFWTVRSLGEIIYWINEQFSQNHRNDCRKMIGYSIVKNDSVYFLYQIFWQSVLIVSVLATISLI